MSSRSPRRCNAQGIAMALKTSAIPAVTLMILGMQAGAGVLFAAALQLAWKTAVGEPRVRPEA